MDTIPQAALEEIIRRATGGPMYRHEYVQMATELKELRARFNKREDLEPATHIWGSREPLIRKLEAMAMGETLIIPGIGHQWTVVKGPLTLAPLRWHWHGGKP